MMRLDGEKQVTGENEITTDGANGMNAQGHSTGYIAECSLPER